MIKKINTADLQNNSSKVENNVAIYKDEKGTIHACSAVCTHMGCTVGFNKTEKTWDCPCHGSRFAVDGKVIQGPATKDLEKIELTQ